jgi:2-succinyl-5-enolpyruvyl-6-hydroxy-3-cyclohexene-1-carboxylate synthase
MNRNTLWSEIFVDELARSGLKAVCAAPGSRHTPLMLAFAKHPDIKVYSHLDERSASFFALGLALASDEPVALICTSGTAGANMYPAIIEAHQSRVPLIVITADRPAEARHSGANQTIDQIKMFGDFVLWFVDMALPEANPPALAIRNLRTTANRAYAKANGIRKGVVHINMPFRKPLEPIPVEGDMVEVSLLSGARGDDIYPKPSVDFKLWSTSPYFLNSKFLGDMAVQHENGIIVCGTNATKSYEVSEAIAIFSKLSGYPIIADPLSNVRFSIDSVASYDTFMRRSVSLISPDIILRVGNIPTSNWLNEYLSHLSPRSYVHITDDGEWSDDSHQITDIFFGAIQFLFGGANAHLQEKHLDRTSALSTQYTALETNTWQVIDKEIETGTYFDGAAVYDVVELIPDGSTLFMGNSLPVRHLDQFGKPQDKRIYTYANRGASGIDGNISSALGAGAARPDKPLVAVVGDITFYHDMNGLLAVHRCGVPITIVLLNNDGGGIFNRLPIKNFEPEFTDYFLTPHGLDFSHAAKMYGLDYILVDAYSDGARDSFRQAFSERVGSGQSTIIEVRTDSRKDEARRQEIVAAVHARLKELNL